MHLLQMTKQLLLSSAVAMSVLLAGVLGPVAYASHSMATMGHETAPIANCAERHQAPTATVSKESYDFEQREDDEPDPSAPVTYPAASLVYPEPHRPVLRLFASSSFIPPDIVIQTAQLRI